MFIVRGSCNDKTNKNIPPCVEMALKLSVTKIFLRTKQRRSDHEHKGGTLRVRISPTVTLIRRGIFELSWYMAASFLVVQRPPNRFMKHYYLRNPILNGA